MSRHPGLAIITISWHDPEAEIRSGIDAACSIRSVSLQNARNTSDVNRDGVVSSLDALFEINDLNRSNTSDEPFVGNWTEFEPSRNETVDAAI